MILSILIGMAVVAWIVGAVFVTTLAAEDPIPCVIFFIIYFGVSIGMAHYYGVFSS